MKFAASARKIEKKKIIKKQTAPLNRDDFVGKIEVRLEERKPQAGF